MTGTVGYFSRLPILDTFGKTDAAIAATEPDTSSRAYLGFERGDGPSVLARQPDYIVPTRLLTLTERPLELAAPASLARVFGFKTERELWASPDFHRRYRLTSFRLGEGAHLVNPHDLEAVGDAIVEAASQDPDEARRRMGLLREQVMEHDVERWAAHFLEALGVGTAAST